MKQLKKYLSQRQPGLMDATGRYAVLVPMVEWQGEVSLLYEVRAERLRRQPGEVCFPGGRMEPGEQPQDCALRETWEELGISASHIEVMGQLDFLVHRANFILYPVLAWVSQTGLERMKYNLDEVARTFLVPLSYLSANPPLEYSYTLMPHTDDRFPYEVIGIPRDYQWQPGGETVPVYPWQDKAIWGMTGRITRHVVQLLDQLNR